MTLRGAIRMAAVEVDALGYHVHLLHREEDGNWLPAREGTIIYRACLLAGYAPHMIYRADIKEAVTISWHLAAESVGLAQA